MGVIGEACTWSLFSSWSTGCKRGDDHGWGRAPLFCATYSPLPGATKDKNVKNL